MPWMSLSVPTRSTLSCACTCGAARKNPDRAIETNSNRVNGRIAFGMGTSEGWKHWRDWRGARLGIAFRTTGAPGPGAEILSGYARVLVNQTNLLRLWEPTSRPCAASIVPARSISNEPNRARPVRPLFNHVVGKQQEFAADRQTQLSRRLEIDNQLEFDRLLHRQ